MERNIVTIRFLITVSGLQFKQITIQEDHSIHTYTLFWLVVLAVENSRKPLFVTCNVYKAGLFLYFFTVPRKNYVS